jgi:hypothetical protein
MKNTRITTLLTGLLALWSAVHAADRIELTDGSVVLGKILSAEAGKFKIETGFAGTIEIAQDKIRSFATDDAVNVGLAAGSTVLGKVEPTGDGIKVVASDGQMTAATGKVAAVWRQGGVSPELRKAKEESAKKERHWAFEASVAIAGRTGVSQKFGANLGFKATLASAQDKLIFAMAAEKARDNGVETANRQFGSVDYSSFFSPDNGWYARTSLEKDTIRQLDMNSSTAFGFGRKLIKNDHQDLEFRLGFDYTYQAYSNNTKFDSPGLDVAFLHTYQFKNAKLVDALSYVPALKEFSNYRIHHESAVELPLGAALWKLKFGVANDYLSVPPAGTKRLDTTYFTSLLLNWQ